MNTLLCPYCGKPAELVRGSALYPHRPDLENRRFWRCSPCRAWVGCHPGTAKPLGRLANAELRRAKQHAHEAFDPIWKDGFLSRSEAYEWLAMKLGIPSAECHVGMMDVAACQRVVEVCRLAMEEPCLTESSLSAALPMAR
jgi:hypothetical protein